MSDLVEKVARAICDYYESLPEAITYSQRKRLLYPERDWYDRSQVRDTARAVIALMAVEGWVPPTPSQAGDGL